MDCSVLLQIYSKLTNHDQLNFLIAYPRLLLAAKDMAMIREIDCSQTPVKIWLRVEFGSDIGARESIIRGFKRNFKGCDVELNFAKYDIYSPNVSITASQGAFVAGLRWLCQNKKALAAVSDGRIALCHFDTRDADIRNKMCLVKVSDDWCIPILNGALHVSSMQKQCQSIALQAKTKTKAL